MTKIASTRIIGLLLTVAGFGGAVWLGLDARRMNADFFRWLDARPMESVIDFSKAGNAEVPFHQTCSSSHGEAFYLGGETEDMAGCDFEDVFADLAGSIIITDSEGTEIEKVAVGTKRMIYSNGRIVIAGIDPFPVGEYYAKIQIDSGVPALADHELTVYAEYQLCGLERIPAYIAGTLAAALGVIGIIAGICSIPGFLRFGVWQEQKERGA